MKRSLIALALMFVSISAASGCSTADVGAPDEQRVMDAVDHFWEAQNSGDLQKIIDSTHPGGRLHAQYTTKPARSFEVSLIGRRERNPHSRVIEYDGYHRLSESKSEIDGVVLSSYVTMKNNYRDRFRFVVQKSGDTWKVADFFRPSPETQGAPTPKPN